MRSTRVALEISTMKEDCAAMPADTRVEPIAAVQAKACGHGTTTTAGRSVQDSNAAPPVISGFIHITIIKDTPTGESRHIQRALIDEGDGQTFIPERVRGSGRSRVHSLTGSHIRDTATPMYANREKGEHISQSTQLF